MDRITRRALCCLLPFVSPVLAVAAAMPCSTSTSRQFLVFGADVRLRGAFCELAERTKSSLLRLLNQDDKWKTPVLIKLEYPQANVPDLGTPPLEVSQLGFGLKIQLNLLLTRALQERSVQRDLLRVILIEWIYRNRVTVAVGTPYVSPPDWLLDGLLALEIGNESSENAQLLESVVEANKIASLEEVVRQPRAQLDRASRRLFDAYSQALVQLLLDTPNGREKLVQYLIDLPSASGDAVADLRAHFPERLGRSADKWWTLSVAQLAASNRHEILSAAETGRLLDRILHFPITGPNGKRRQYSLGDYARFRNLPDAALILEEVSRQLLQLSLRAHPLYHLILEENYELIRLLARGNSKQLADRLERLKNHRRAIERQAGAIGDYLDWYEATQPKTISGAFSLVPMEKEAGEELRARRRDPISVYLDAIEIEMQ